MFGPFFYRLRFYRYIIYHYESCTCAPNTIIFLDIEASERTAGELVRFRVRALRTWRIFACGRLGTNYARLSLASVGQTHDFGMPGQGGI
jgi:hypothetical protein